MQHLAGTHHYLSCFALLALPLMPKIVPPGMQMDANPSFRVLRSLTREKRRTFNFQNPTPTSFLQVGSAEFFVPDVKAKKYRQAGVRHLTEGAGAKAGRSGAQSATGDCPTSGAQFQRRARIVLAPG
jgi:hypothetical protein